MTETAAPTISTPTGTPTPSAPNRGQEVPRGITPKGLIELVRNTVPFLLKPDFSVSSTASHLQNLQLTAASLATSDTAELTHSGYFELCLSAHYGTVSSFVPTDVDNQIRYKLWQPGAKLETLLTMADTVVKSLDWDFTALSTRFVRGPRSGNILSGVHGEWFSVAAASYCALRRKAPEKASELAALIVRETEREASIFLEFAATRDGIGLLKAATLIAHNLGDLDRVMDQWNLHPQDSLREAVYKAGHPGDGKTGSDEIKSSRKNSPLFNALSRAGALNKEMMADENHRHFALRTPKCLRKSQDFLLPIAPFFDEWGTRVGKHPALSPEEVAEISQALIDGWEKLAKPVGYSRALAGILETFPGGLNRLSQYLPARSARTLKAGPLRTLCATPRARFEDQWASKALSLLQ